MLNVNVGVLGHVDCGKTSLVAALSTTLSTAALDKHPQSKERGITLDLGFSAFTVPVPEQLQQQLGHQQQQHDTLQFTLVDCPGHASLIRTIIGGAQIIDTMILVVDVTKGIQAQTAECLVVGEIAAKNLLVALNKVDTLPEDIRPRAVKKATKLLHATLAGTKFGKAPVIPVAAKPVPIGIDDLKAWLVNSVVQQQHQQQQQQQQQQQPPEQQLQQLKQQQQPEQQQRPFLFSIDHCFPIKGQGTVMTGTVLQGSCKVNDSIELPSLKLCRPVKSMQAFHKPVQSIQRGDRAGICVTQLNPKLVERGLAAAPGSVPTFSAAIAVVDRVRFYAGAVPSKQKYHLIVGHATVMAEATFFGLPDGQGVSQAASLQHMIAFLNKTAQHSPLDPFDWTQHYLHQQELYGLEGRPLQHGAPTTAATTASQLQSGAAAAAADEEQSSSHHGPQWALLKFDQPLTAPADAVVIGARLDFESSGDTCRLAFYGRLLAQLGAGAAADLQRLHVYKLKERRGSISRTAADGCSAICKGLFKRESDMSFFEGAQVVTGRGERGVIQGRFGTTGKFKVEFQPPGLQGVVAGAAAGSTTEQQQQQRSQEDNAIILRFKRFLFDPSGSKQKLRQ